MRVLVCGGRDFSDRGAIHKALNDLSRAEVIDAVIEGDAHGADRIAGYWARQRGITNLKFKADWATHGKGAGPIRNQRMIDEGRPDLVVAFPGGKGTADMTRRARSAGIDVVEVG